VPRARFRIAENIHHIDRLGNIRQCLKKMPCMNDLAGKAGIDADHMVTVRLKKGENTIGRTRFLIRRANHRDGFHGSTKCRAK